MRLNAHKYAVLLNEATEGKKDKELESIVGRFIDLLAQRHDTTLLGAIVDELERLKKDEHEASALHIATAQVLPKELIEHMRAKLAAPVDAPVMEYHDGGLRGGMQARYADLVLDATVRTLLSQWKYKLINE